MVWKSALLTQVATFRLLIRTHANILRLKRHLENVLRSIVEVKHRILHQVRLMKHAAALLRIKHCHNIIRPVATCWIV